mmetsp:Transcript_56522/g.158603  ORF Transcript_56522/g.158603 Transcript_56522/m.158603 type:complete len:367 (-) Transcript_56522:296-1396(-)
MSEGCASVKVLREGEDQNDAIEQVPKAVGAEKKRGPHAEQLHERLGQEPSQEQALHQLKGPRPVAVRGRNAAEGLHHGTVDQQVCLCGDDNAIADGEDKAEHGEPRALAHPGQATVVPRFPQDFSRPTCEADLREDGPLRELVHHLPQWPPCHLRRLALLLGRRFLVDVGEVRARPDVWPRPRRDEALRKGLGEAAAIALRLRPRTPGAVVRRRLVRAAEPSVRFGRGASPCVHRRGEDLAGAVHPAAGCVVLHRSALAATWRWLGPTPCRFGGRQLGFFHNLELLRAQRAQELAALPPILRASAEARLQAPLQALAKLRDARFHAAAEAVASLGQALLHGFEARRHMRWCGGERLHGAPELHRRR